MIGIIKKLPTKSSLKIFMFKIFKQTEIVTQLKKIWFRINQSTRGIGHGKPMACSYYQIHYI
jgi:hypothetical protein